MMIYLLHFGTTAHASGHYIGSTEEHRFRKRIAEHRHGKGSAYVRELQRQGESFVVAKTWSSKDRQLERQLQHAPSYAAICPICQSRTIIAA